MRRFSSSSIATIGRIWWFDLRTMGLLALAVLMAQAFVVSPTLQTFAAELPIPIPWVRIWFLIWIVAFLAVRSLSPARTAFWRVRPIAPGNVLAAKLLLLIALLASGPVLIDFSFLYLADVGGGVPLASLIESSLYSLSSVLLPTCLAALFPDRRFVVASLALGAILFLGQLSTRWFAPSGAYIPDLTFVAYSSSVALLFLTLAYLRPRTRNLAPWAIAVLFAGYPVVCALAVQPWPESPNDWNFENLAVLPEIDEETQLRIDPPESRSFENQPNQDLYLYVDTSWGGDFENLSYRGQILEAHFEIEGKRSWHIRYPDSKEAREPSVSLGMPDRHHVPTGLRPHRRLSRDLTMVISRADVPSYWNEKGTLTLTVGLREKKAESLGWLPLEKGTELFEDGATHSLENFRLDEDSLHIQLRRRQHFNELRNRFGEDLKPGARIPGWITFDEMERLEEIDRQPDLWNGKKDVSHVPSWVMNFHWEGPGIVSRLERSVRYLPDPRLESAPARPEKIELWRPQVVGYSERTVKLEDVTLKQLARRHNLHPKQSLFVPRATIVNGSTPELEVHQ